MQLSASALRIRTIAVEHFAAHGYEGSSLNVIAEAAGMRKASLYFHFAGKDALFLDALADAFAVETAHASATFAADSAKLPGLMYLAAIGERYDTSASLRLLLRAAYAPPAELRDGIMQQHRAFVDHLGALFAAGLTVSSTAGRTKLVDAYLGAVDSLHVEALFGVPEYVDRRRTALWELIEHYADSVA